MRPNRSATALFAAATFFGMTGIAFGANPTQADFDACNREAQISVQSPAASPGSGAMTGAGGASNTTASGSASGSAGAPSGVSGTVSRDSNSTSSDSTLLGMAAAGVDDQAYQQAYRDCMRRRGF